MKMVMSEDSLAGRKSGFCETIDFKTMDSGGQEPMLRGEWPPCGAGAQNGGGESPVVLTN